MTFGRTATGEVVRRAAPTPGSVSAPLRRGAAAVVVTGGALALAGVAATVPLQGQLPDGAPSQLTAAAVLPVGNTAPAEPSTAGGDAGPASPLTPVPARHTTADTERLDTAKLVKAAQLAERSTGTATPAPTSAPPSGPAPAADAPAAGASGGDTAERDRGAATKDAPTPSSSARPAAPSTSAAPAAADCDLDTSQLGAVKPHVRAAATFIGCRYGEPTVLGVAGRAGTSDHPSGKALDFMVDKATGNAIAACALRNQEELGVSYVIWRQRINFGSGWKPMEDRGGDTANHMDHVHVSFESKAGGRPTAC